MTTGRGFTLVEVIVALLIISVVALGLAQTLIAAQNGRRTSAAWMQATQLAAEQLERIRSGAAVAPREIVGAFERTWRSEGVGPYPDLRRIEVTIAWNDREPREYRLMALVPLADSPPPSGATE